MFNPMVQETKKKWKKSKPNILWRLGQPFSIIEFFLMNGISWKQFHKF
jgi:hypothetical protein